MAIAAYAAVVSLVHVLDQLQQYPPPHLLYLDRDRIKTLHEKVSVLQEFLELHSQRFYAGLEGLARQIADVAAEAEDLVDAYVVDQLISQTPPDEHDIDLSFFWKLGEDIADSNVEDQIRDRCPDHNGALTLFGKNIERVIESIDSIIGKLMMFKEVIALEKLQPRVSPPAASISLPSTASGKNSMVGFKERLVRIMEELMVYRSDLQILPIVGMGGIGKTTLARNVFDDPCIVYHFHVRLWVTVSQEYNARDIVQGLLQGLRELGVMKKKEKSDDDLEDLGEKLYKSLSGRKYLVAMDDVWSSKVWDDLHAFFPDNKNGSRIMVTSRLSDVTASFGSNNPFFMDFLDKEQSWNLFCKKAFAKKSCPPELEKIGKHIAKSCKGLPLAIVVIGGLLLKSNMTKQYWEYIADDVCSFANSANDEHCLKILSLSYNHLSIHLKPCFLYMGVFREDDKIEDAELIKLWVAQGFLKPIKDRTLDEVAEEYLEDLTSRNLIFRFQRNFWDVGTCGMHDLLRDLCIRESHKEHFYCIGKVQKFARGTTCFLCSSRRACTRIDLPRVNVDSQLTSPANCLVCDSCRINNPQLKSLRWVKVLDTAEDILHPTKLRYLVIPWSGKLVGNLIHLLWNLQTLICYPELHLPSEIWKLPQLRHLATRKAVLADPPLITEVDRKDSTIILKNLQTLSYLLNFRWSEDVIERLPNLKTLGIRYYEVEEWSYYSLQNLGCLHKLESLFLTTKAPLSLKKNIAVPHSLRKLCLSDCEIPWEEMTIIGSLPKLEVLELYSSACKGSEWNPSEGEFLRLKRLRIYENHLEYWGAEKVHFPNLEHLQLGFMDYLEEIPSGIGEIETLHSIWLYNCTATAIDSAKALLEDQHSLGNEDFQLYVDYKLVSPDSG